MCAGKIVVTGAAGFVGRHLVELLRDRYPVSQVVSIYRSAPDEIGFPFKQLDLTDKAAIERMVIDLQPSHIVHLAAVPTLAGVKSNPDAAWMINVTATLHLAEAILTHVPGCVLHFASSSEVYGASALARECLDEKTLLAPTSQYAASKAAADLGLGAFVHQGLKVIRFRPFNHTGPGQSPDFVIPAFAYQIVRIEAGKQPPIIRVGNLDAERDFIDVRDITRAYGLSIQMSDEIPNGTIINLASGVPHRIGDLLERLLSMSSAKIEIQADPHRQRPNEIRRYFGNAQLAMQVLGWMPERTLDSTLSDVLQYFRSTQAR